MENIICKAEINAATTGTAKAVRYIIWCTTAAVCIPFILYFLNDEYPEMVTLSSGILAGVIVLTLIFESLYRSAAKRCSLELTSTEVRGRTSLLFSSHDTQLPLDKVDTVARFCGFGDKYRGGKTVGVRTAGGIVRFAWIQNADEFVRAVLTELEKYKKEMYSIPSNEKSSTAESQSSASKIKELKGLLDSELISQEEFDRKRAELLEKM